MSANTKERLTANHLNSLSITFLFYFKKTYTTYNSFIMKAYILYISFTPLPPFLWELTCDIFIYLILILYFIQYLRLYFKVLSNILNLFHNFCNSAEVAIVTRETTESFSTFIDKKNFQSK